MVGANIGTLGSRSGDARRPPNLTKAAPGSKHAAARGRGVAPAEEWATLSKPLSISASVAVNRVTGGEVIGTQINRRQHDTFHGNQVKVARGGQASVNTGISGPVNITGPVTFVQGATGLQSGAGPVLQQGNRT